MVKVCLSCYTIVMIKYISINLNIVTWIQSGEMTLRCRHRHRCCSRFFDSADHSDIRQQQNKAELLTTTTALLELLKSRHSWYDTNLLVRENESTERTANTGLTNFCASRSAVSCVPSIYLGDAVADD